MAEDKRTRDDKIAKFFSSERLVRVFRPLAEEVFSRGGSPEDLERIGEDRVLRQTLAGYIINVSVQSTNAPETKPVRAWREQDGIFYFSVTSDGTSGPDWITRLESKGSGVGSYAKSVLRSPDFKPTSDVTIEIAVLPGTLWSDGDRITRKIRAKAKKRKLGKPNAEVACLIREMFTDEEIEAMGLWWIVAMHKPIKDHLVGHPHLLSARRGRRWSLAARLLRRS